MTDQMQGLLQKDPRQRLRAKDAINHPYFDWFVRPEHRRLMTIPEAPAITGVIICLKLQMLCA